ncbi:MAG: substrate-binding domain-containing protein, partial [Oscillospiraceae bacterium]|nr:substrate-binding domain-containing protein [Oscillospiraceae bacterium]
MTKRLISLILALMLCLSLLAGCGEAPVPPAAQPTPEASPEPTPEPTPELAPEIEGTPFAFTRENMPLMDGSTSLVPLAQAAASVLLGENRDDTEALTQFNRTSQSYRNLMWDYCDILIASVPAESVFEELEQQSFAYEMEPIATDALIFVVNEANGVDNLTTEEIIGIYSGEITNWSQVGGADEPIAPFQRNAGAGSQALMEKLVMKDVPMMTPPAEYMAGSMGMLMEYVKSYDNSANAIGYSVYYYANDMRMADGLKIISVDGVEPTDENIRSGAYPHLSNYYTVIAADEPSDSPARVMFEWLQSAEGQRLVEREGYVPVMDLTDAPEKTATSGGFVV